MLNLLLAPLSYLYALTIWIRNQLYARRVFRAKRLPCPVISVGNLIAGGTGKTPAVLAIAKRLQKAGVRVAILLRGYKRSSGEKITVVSDGQRVYASERESGDEAYMLARILRDVPILVGRDRYRAGQIALERFQVDVLLLDDAFQHRQLARDLDILTVPATHPFGNPPKLLPAGLLREPPTALQRADILLLTHADTPEIAASAKAAVQRFTPDALILQSVHQPTHLYPLNREENNFSVEMLKGKRLLAVCGIGTPDAFVRTLMRCHPDSVELLPFPDHHVYTETDAKRIDAAFRAAKAEWVVTTQKDAAKLAAVVDPQHLPVVVLEIALIMTEGDEKLKEVLKEAVF